MEGAHEGTRVCPEHGSALFQKMTSKSRASLALQTDIVDDQPFQEQFQLTDEGFSSVQRECCELSFDMYARKLLLSLGMEICDEGCHNGFIPFFYCGKSPTLEDFTAHIQQKSQELCGCYKPVGQCLSGGLPAACYEENTGEYIAGAHRRRMCSTPTTTTITDRSSVTTTGSPASTTKRIQTTSATATEAVPGPSTTTGGNIEPSTTTTTREPSTTTSNKATTTTTMNNPTTMTTPTVKLTTTTTPTTATMTTTMTTTTTMMPMSTKTTTTTTTTTMTTTTPFTVRTIIRQKMRTTAGDVALYGDDLVVGWT